jgi:hypothetical protein
MPYTYQPLADPDSEIRLATIQPGAVDDPDTCRLPAAALDVKQM